MAKGANFWGLVGTGSLYAEMNPPPQQAPVSVPSQQSHLASRRSPGQSSKPPALVASPWPKALAHPQPLPS